MTAPHVIDPARFLSEQLEQASPDLMRSMLTTFINALMSAEADAVCGAEYGARSEARSNSRNGYRHRDFDTRTGTLDVAIPKLRQGSYFPDWLVQVPGFGNGAGPGRPGRGVPHPAAGRRPVHVRGR
ncbi:hypothetical protein QFZ33_002542 [Arthrobacter globiformis]|nr:hypothetical protein [Arthrobacter globiformis]